MSRHQPSVVVLGGGPGGYEAALVAARAGAQVTVVDRDGLGGACVLTDCVPSKALVSTAAFMGGLRTGDALGVREADDATVDLAAVNRRILALAASQSTDIAGRLEGDGVRIVRGRGSLIGPDRSASRRRRAPPRSSTPTSSSSPPARRRAPCRRPSRTASGSSPGSRSTR